eukprot:1570471-Rhodomonas_salina.1
MPRQTLPVSNEALSLSSSARDVAVRDKCIRGKPQTRTTDVSMPTTTTDNAKTMPKTRAMTTPTPETTRSRRTQPQAQHRPRWPSLASCSSSCAHWSPAAMTRTERAPRLCWASTQLS